MSDHHRTGIAFRYKRHRGLFVLLSLAAWLSFGALERTRFTSTAISYGTNSELTRFESKTFRCSSLKSIAIPRLVCESDDGPAAIGNDLIEFPSTSGLRNSRSPRCMPTDESVRRPHRMTNSILLNDFGHLRVGFQCVKHRSKLFRNIGG
jgi:hypothetical protein